MDIVCVKYSIHTDGLHEELFKFKKKNGGQIIGWMSMKA